MKKMSAFLEQLGYLFFLLLVSGLFIIITTLARCTSPTNDNNEYDPPPIENIAIVHTVEISQMTFSPSNIKVQKGDTIIFINHDMVVHDITEASSKKWVSPPLQPEQSWTIKVDEAAEYYCSLHPIMKGTINIK